MTKIDDIFAAANAAKQLQGKVTALSLSYTGPRFQATDRGIYFGSSTAPPKIGSNAVGPHLLLICDNPQTLADALNVVFDQFNASARSTQLTKARDDLATATAALNSATGAQVSPPTSV